MSIKAELGVKINSQATEYDDKTFEEVQEIARQFNEEQRLKYEASLTKEE